MKPLFIPETPKTPLVNCNCELGMIELSGMSYSEDTFAFYEPVFLWLNKYALQPHEETNFNMKIKYFNTGAVKCLFDILEIFSKLSQQGNKVNVNWFYDVNDKELLASGEDYSAMLGYPFNMIEEKQF
jgi:hypothetical protein